MRQQRWRRGGAVRSWRVRLFQGQDEQKLSIASCRCTVILSRAGDRLGGRRGHAPRGNRKRAGVHRPAASSLPVRCIGVWFLHVHFYMHMHMQSAHCCGTENSERRPPCPRAPDSLRSRSRTAIPSRFVAIRDGSHAESGAPSPTSTSHSLEVTPVLGPSSGAASSHPAARSPDREGGRDKCTCKYDALLVH